LPQKPEQSDISTVRSPGVVKAYPVGRYQDSDDPDLMHEGHTVYREENTPEWNTAPNAPTYVPLGPTTVAVADPAQQHTVLTAELEQRLKQEDQLLHTTYEQNERLAQEIKDLQASQQHLPLVLSPTPSPVATPKPQPQTPSPSQPSSVIPAPQSKSWF
jgi:hypothetical protein